VLQIHLILLGSPDPPRAGHLRHACRWERRWAALLAQRLRVRLDSHALHVHRVRRVLCLPSVVRVMPESLEMFEMQVLRA